MTDYPILYDLMSSYFHQDYDLMGNTDDEIVMAFARTHSSDDVGQAVAEIDRMLATPLAGLKERYAQATGAMNMIIGDDDASSREWLQAARRVLSGTIVQ